MRRYDDDDDDCNRCLGQKSGQECSQFRVDLALDEFSQPTATATAIATATGYVPQLKLQTSLCTFMLINKKLFISCDNSNATQSTDTADRERGRETA